MLPNKTVAFAFVVLLTAQLFAGQASAQGPVLSQGPDLVVDDISVGRERVAGVPQQLNVTIRNMGDSLFTGATGWSIFVGLNGLDETNCIEPGDDVAGNSGITFNSPCFIRMAPGQPAAADGTNASSIPAGGRANYTLMWNATDLQAAERATVFVEILTFSGSPGTSQDTCPDPGNCANNVYQRREVNIARLGVRAVPLRLAPQGVDTDANDPWTDSEITTACPLPPTAVDRGCRVPAGRTLIASYLVTNSGTIDDTYSPSLDLPETRRADYERYGWVFAFAPANFSLAKGASRVVNLTIVVPENATAFVNRTNINTSFERVQWTSQRSPFVHTARDTNPGCREDPAIGNFCRNPTLPSFIVDIRRGLNATITDNQTWRQVLPGDLARWTIQLNNTGNANDVYNISFVNESRTINDSWLPQITNPGIVEPGWNTHRLAEISVRPPRNATNGTYWFDVILKSARDADGSGRCRYQNVSFEGQCLARFYVHLGQEWRIAPLTDAPTRLVSGETWEYKLGIRNDGNGYDNVTLDLQTTVAGWDVRLSDRVAQLTPFNSTNFTLTVTSPPNVQKDTVAAFYVNATSNGPIETPFELRSRAVIESVMTIIEGTNMRLTAPVEAAFIDPGATASFTVNVYNVGNVADNFTIPVPQRPDGWGVTVDPPYVELEPNQARDVVISLTAPTLAPVGEKAPVVVKVRSTVDSTREKTISLEGRISGPDLVVRRVSVSPENAYSGDALEVAVEVANEGNKGAERNATLRVVFEQGGVERVIGERVYAPNAIPGQRHLVETFPWDTTGIEGSGTLRAIIDVEDAVEEIEESEESNEGTALVTLRTFEIAITPAQGLTARPGEEVTYGEAPNVFTITYTGNQPVEPVTIRIESEHGWLASDERDEISLALPRGTPLPILAKLKVPEVPGAGQDTLTITVVPAFRPTEVLRASTITTILDEEKPIISRIQVSPPAPKIGDQVWIDVFVQDATGVSSVTAYITAPTNETSSLVLSKVADGRWNASKTFTVAGQHVARAEAADSASPPNQNKTRETSATFTIAPGSAPVIQLAAGQSTTIRTGAPIKLSITDPLGVGRATYSIRGVSYDLRGPAFEIDTSTFPAGPVELTVTAENIYGVSSSQKFSFTVDNVAPGITRVTMSPERPRANEDVTLTIATEPQVEAVEVLIKRDGQVLQTVNATRKGAGTFEVKFNPPEGDYRIDVTARDAAGNTKLAESAVVFSARPGSPFGVPGPSVALLLAGAALVALLARRRR